MAITAITTEPTYAPPGKVRLVFTASGGGNYVRVWCTNAPVGSQWRTKLDQSAANAKAARVLMVECGVAEKPDVELDVGGVYVLAAQEYTRGAASYGGGHKGDPDSYDSETKLGAEATLSVYVGQRLVSPIGAPEYGTAKLVVWVWNGTIRATTATTHGERTPAIFGATGKALTAAENTSVLSHVDALADITPATSMAGLAALHAELQLDLPLHFNNNGGAWHNVADAYNDSEIESLPAAPATPEGYYYAAQVMLRRLRCHMVNDDGSGAGGRLLHATGGGSVAAPDYGNLPVASRPSGSAHMALAMAAYGELYRAYVAHIANTSVHSAADTTNTIVATVPPLLDLHAEFIDAQRTLSPTAPATQNPAATELIHSAGFIEIPPSI